MTRRTPLPNHLAKTSFTLQSARLEGIQRSRTRAEDLSTPSRGIRVPREVHLDTASQLRTYIEATPGALISHTSAAKLLGLPLPLWVAADPSVHLSRPHPSARPQRRWVVGHSLKLGPEDITVFDGLPTTSVCRTWLDLAGMLSLDDLIVAGDYLVSAHQRTFGPERLPLIEHALLGTYLKAQSGHRWICKARVAYDELRVGVDSPPETLVRLVLQRAGLPQFQVNYAITDTTGHPRVWTDLGCPEFQTCIEYDGLHHLTPEQQLRDATRDQLTAELGWKQLKLNRIDLAAGPEQIELKVTRALRLQGWTGRPMPPPNSEIGWARRRRRRQI